MKHPALLSPVLAIMLSAPASLAQVSAGAERPAFSAGASVSPNNETPASLAAPGPATLPGSIVALPSPVNGATPAAPSTPPDATSTTVAKPDAPPAASTPTAVTPAPTTAPAPATGALPNGGILLNFQGASLNDVLTYLSETAGFVIVQEAPVQGTINLVSRQPLSPEDAVDTLNSVLIDKGYTAVRNGRVLKVIRSNAALKHPDTPVIQGAKSELIPRKDNIVTQIIPIRFGEAAKLVENLRPLLADSASITANDSSNAIILTDTQTNIRRVVQIVQALDTSVANISTITVFPLKFADSKEVATMVTQLFAAPTQNNGQGQQGRRGGGGGGGGFPGFGGFGFGGGGPGGPGGGGNQGAAQSEARTAASKVVAVSDEQSNSVIVSCPEDLVPTIREMIIQIDTSITDVTDTRIFRLQNADATELATIITNLFSDSTTTNQSSQRNGRGGGGFGFPFGGQPQAANANQSTRSLKQGKVTAVGDPRTNSLLVTAAQDSMANVAEIIGRLDATSAKKQHIYTHAVQYGDPNNVANVLRGMLGQGTTTQPIDRLNDRQNTGATISTDVSSSSGLGGSGRTR